MGEFATQSNLDGLASRMLNVAEYRASGGSRRLQPKGLMRLDQRVAAAHTKDNVRALERLTQPR